MKKITQVLGFLFLLVPAFAQTSLTGIVTDAISGETLYGAQVILYHSGVFVAGTSTDLDGRYNLPNIDPKTYDLEVSYIGLVTKKITGITIIAGQKNSYNVTLDSDGGITLDMVVVTDYKVPLIEVDKMTSGSIITSEQIRNLPTKNVQALAAISAGLRSIDQGSAVSVRGSRSSNIDYYIDGLRVTNEFPQPSSNQPLSWEIYQQNQFLGGTPANFSGDPLNPLWPGFSDPAFEFPPKPSLRICHDPVSPNEEYLKIVENDFIRPSKEAFSTFSIDVDRAAYGIIRRDILAGRKPSPNAARTEEMVNYFSYDYPQPNGEHPFAVYTEVGVCPWNTDHHLLHIGLQGTQLNWQETPAANLVFLIDVSGSMSSANKLELLKPSFKLLVEQLRAQDRVSIVVYAGAAGMVLPPTPGDQKETIIAAIDQLRSGGSTAGGAGIQLAYKIARENFIADGTNRVILATDGDFNVGVSSQEDLKSLIEEKRKEQIFLTVLGFGFGNLKDNRLETLADAGNGNYAFIDDLKEAKKVFINEIAGTLVTIAKDVKLQLVFNSSTVKSYRLIGYENRLLARQDFDDDTKDAGELGAGHTVTAIYEIIPQESFLQKNKQRLDICPVEENPIKKRSSTVSSEQLVRVKLRYKKPTENQSHYLDQLVDYTPLLLEQTSDNFRFAAAVVGFSLLLKDSKYKGDLNVRQVTKLAKEAMGTDPFGHRKEFVSLVKKWEDLEMVSTK